MRHFNLESLDLLLSSLDLKSLVIFIAFPTEKSKREKKYFDLPLFGCC